MTSNCIPDSFAPEVKREKMLARYVTIDYYTKKRQNFFLNEIIFCGTG
jgi:hypothetical protein